MYHRSRSMCAVLSPGIDFADFVDVHAMALWDPLSFKLVKAVSKTRPLELCKCQQKFSKLFEVCWRIYASVKGVNIGAACSLSPIRCEAITWINADLLSSKSSETNSSKIWKCTRSLSKQWLSIVNWITANKRQRNFTLIAIMFQKCTSKCCLKNSGLFHPAGMSLQIYVKTKNKDNRRRQLQMQFRVRKSTRTLESDSIQRIIP